MQICKQIAATARAALKNLRLENELLKKRIGGNVDAPTQPRKLWMKRPSSMPPCLDELRRAISASAQRKHRVM
jgi:hypothetical protein